MGKFTSQKYFKALHRRVKINRTRMYEYIWSRVRIRRGLCSVAKFLVISDYICEATVYVDNIIQLIDLFVFTLVLSSGEGIGVTRGKRGHALHMSSIF